MIPLRDINPTRRFAVVTFVLIVLNIAVFVLELTLGRQATDAFMNTYALVPARLFGPKGGGNTALPVYATIFTSMFIHGGFLHIAGNMLFLWIFGNNVEDAMGRMRYAFFYTLCGFCAAYAHAWMNRASTVPMIGASGAISGVLGAYLVLYPRARVITLIFLGFFIRTIEVPAMAVLGFWFALQFLNAIVESGVRGGVAWYAHVAGFITGVILIGFFKRKNVPFWGGRRPHTL